MNANDIMRAHAAALAARLAASGRRVLKQRCPLCSETRRKSDEPCMSTTFGDDGLLLYNCHHCGAQGAVPLEGKAAAPPPRKAAPLAPDNYIAPPTEEVWAWLQGRGITRAAIEAHPYAARGSLPMVGVAPKGGWAAFPMVDDEGNLINVQYRHLETKRFKLVPGQPQTFYLYNRLCAMPSERSPNTLVITEGQLDALSVMVSEPDVGVVSLPNGTSNLSFDPAAWAYIAKHFRTIVVATDGDAPGEEAAANIVKRLGLHRCRRVKYPEGAKDFNDVLQQYGPEAVRALIHDAMPMPVEGVATAAGMRPHIEAALAEWPDAQRAVSGMAALDHMVRFARGEIVVLTGVPGHGKSTFLDQLAVNIAHNSGWRFAVLSFEKYSHAYHAAELMEKYLRRPMIGTLSPHWSELHAAPPPTPTDIERAFSFVDRHFVFFDVSDPDHGDAVYRIENIIERLTAVHIQYNIDAFILDNLSYIDRGKFSENDGVNNILNKLILFAKRYNVCIFVVAHPRKPDGSSAGYIPRGYEVAGTANIYNKVDIGLTLYRDFDTGTTSLYKWKQRHRDAGSQSVTQIDLVFMPEYSGFETVDF